MHSYVTLSIKANRLHHGEIAPDVCCSIHFSNFIDEGVQYMIIDDKCFMHMKCI